MDRIWFMSVDDVMARLEALGNEKVRAMNLRNGAGEKTFGVKMGDIRVLAKEIKSDPGLASDLWQTGVLEARLLAILLLRPKQLSSKEVERMVIEAKYAWLADWLNSYVVKAHPEKEMLRQRWMQSEDPWLLRSGWSLTAERIEKSPEDLDIESLLDRIEREMLNAPEAPKWTMNFALAGIGIHFPEHRERAVAIGEKLGVYRDYPVSKGCTSPFAPVWIRAMVGRNSTSN